MSELTPKERVMNLFRREPVDTMPCFSGMGMVTIQAINEMGIRFAQVHTSAEHLARSAKTTAELFGFELDVRQRLTEHLALAATGDHVVEGLVGEQPVVVDRLDRHVHPVVGDVGLVELDQLADQLDHDNELAAMLPPETLEMLVGQRRDLFVALLAAAAAADEENDRPAMLIGQAHQPLETSRAIAAAAVRVVG